MYMKSIVAAAVFGFLGWQTGGQVAEYGLAYCLASSPSLCPSALL
jgi:hypothetical protein